MNSARKIQCGVGLLFLLLCTARVGAAQTCASPWNSTSVYTAGMQASLNGINYTANFWTQNQNPATNNGGPGSGQPWTDPVVAAAVARVHRRGTRPVFTPPA
jgi:hypothetical protein